VLQTLDSYGLSEPAVGSDHGSNINHYISILKRRFFYFLLPFGLISIVGLYVAATLKPSYLSEGKILLEGQNFAADIVRPVMTATSNDRVQVIQQRVTTRDTLLAIASKFDLFPAGPGAVEAMRKSLQIKPVREVEAQLKQGIMSSTIAFTVGFEYGDPEIAMRVANEFVNLIVGEDARSRTSRATEAVRILSDEAKDIETSSRPRKCKCRISHRRCVMTTFSGDRKWNWLRLPLLRRNSSKNRQFIPTVIPR